MANKKNNTYLYAGLAAAALLLFRKKDSGMAGVGTQKTKVSDFYARRGNGYMSYYITYTSPQTGHAWEFHTNDEDDFELAKGYIDNPKQKDLDNLKWRCKNYGGRVK